MKPQIEIYTGEYPRPGDPGYWEWRGRTGFVGKPKAFKDPQELWNLACEYFERIDSMPFEVQEQRKGSVRIEKGMDVSEIKASIENPVVNLKITKPYTWAGFEDYLLEQGYVRNLAPYRLNIDKRYDDFQEVMKSIANVMYAQKHNGATVGIYNANIIARDLGLTDKIQTNVVIEQPLFGDDEK